MPRSGRRAAAARRASGENETRSVSSAGANSVAGDSGADQVEAAVQQVPGAGDQGRMDMEAAEQPAAGAGARVGRGRASPLPIPAPMQAARGVAPAPSQDAIDVASVTPLLKLVGSQHDASRMRPAELDRWHLHGKMFATYKVAPFGEVPMTPGAQQKLIIWLKDTATALVAYRATSLEHEQLILQKLSEAILPPAKLTWNAAVETAEAQQPSMGARRGVGTASLIWRTLRAFLRCYDNPHGKDEMEQRLTDWTWGNTIPETQASFNELVDIWTQAAQQTATLDFARQIETPTQHAILNQIVRKMPPWAKKHMQDHPRKYSSVPNLWVSLKEEEACRLQRSSTGDVPGNMHTFPQDLPTRASILTLAQAIIAEETDGGEPSATVAQGYGDDTAPISLGLHFLGQQLPRGPNGEFECMRCGGTHWHRKCNAPESLEELAGQHHSTWPRVTPVVGNQPGAPPITQAPSTPTVGPTRSNYPRPVPAPTGSRAAEAPVSQRGPLQALARHMLDLQHRVAGRERDTGPASSPPSPLLSLVSPAVASASDSIIIEGPGVTVPLDFVPAGIYQGRRVWAAPVMDDDQHGPRNGP